MRCWERIIPVFAKRLRLPARQPWRCLRRQLCNERYIAVASVISPAASPGSPLSRLRWNGLRRASGLAADSVIRVDAAGHVSAWPEAEARYAAR